MRAGGATNTTRDAVFESRHSCFSVKGEYLAHLPVQRHSCANFDNELPPHFPLNRYLPRASRDITSRCVPGMSISLCTEHLLLSASYLDLDNGLRCHLISHCIFLAFPAVLLIHCITCINALVQWYTQFAHSFSYFLSSTRTV